MEPHPRPVFRERARGAFVGGLLAFLAAIVWPAVVLAGHDAKPVQLIEELPTLKCLGVRWIVAGDDNRNAEVTVAYRRLTSLGSDGDWKRGPNLFRVQSEAILEPNRPAAGQTMFAGSIFDLDEDTEYELKLVLHDPDGVDAARGDAEHIVRMKTWSEPRHPVGGKTIEVRPGQLQQALRDARPGDTLRLHAGVYTGPFGPPSGAPEQPIAILGAGDGPAILDGQGGGAVISQSGLHDVILENLTIRNAEYGIAVNEAARITVRRCTIADVDYGFVATRNGPVQQHIYIADNVLIGRSRWPRSEGIEDRRGVQLAGTGHVVCYNRISRFGDAIDTFSVYPCASIDFYGNEISECTDDGIEMDYSEHNTRCFDNRLTNVFQGISAQPIHGGPVYIFRNAMYNVGMETFKLHNSPSGVLLLHNTSVKSGMPLMLLTSETVTNCVSRNNLFVGTTANYGYENMARMRGCDFDYDGFGGQWKLFMKFNGERYASMDDARQNAPAYRHAVRVDPATLFVSGLQPPADVAVQFRVEQNDLRLAAKSTAIDAGIAIPGINDNFRGKAPDLGVYEVGVQLPHYGPRTK